MPPDESNSCEYARQWDFLMNKYEMALDAEDLETIDDVLGLVRSHLKRAENYRFFRQRAFASWEKAVAM